MIEKLRKLIVTGGLEPAEYKEIVSDIDRNNRNLSMVFAIFALLLTGSLIGISYLHPQFESSRRIYMTGAIASMILWLTAWLGRFKSIFIYIAVYTAETFFMAYSVLLEVIHRPNQPAVTFMVMLVLLPMIFIDKPYRTITIQYAWTIIFIAGSIWKKSKDIYTIDIVHALIFSGLAAFACVYLTQSKFNNFLMEEQLHIMSTKDQLTGLNNRNCYEWMIQTYKNVCNESLCAIYIDVNGLHDLNNSQGHQAGDEMLTYIAQQVQNQFGTQHTYRIGGDEYIAFVLDGNSADINARVQALKQDVEYHNYHVAVGVEKQFKDSLDTIALIKKAESRMYKNKEEYYKSIGKEHR